LLYDAANGQFLGLHMEGNRRRINIPIEVYNNLVVVPVMLNNSVPLKFILDTGVRSTILIEKTYTDLLGVQYSRKITLYGVGNNKTVEAYVATNVSIELPGLDGAGQSMLVLEEDYLNLRNHLGTEVHGIIGYDVFSRFVVEINYQRNLLTLHKPLFYKPRPRDKAIDLEVYDTKPYVQIPLQLNDTVGIQAKLMIDTGASHALVLHTDSHERITLPGQNIETKLGRGLAGEIEGHLARIDGVQLSDYALSDVIVSYPDDATYSDSLFVAERNGTIGGEMLRKFRVVIDFFGEKIYLRKNARYKKPFDYNMSGIEFSARGNDLNTFVIYDVRKYSPAHHAEVMPGDTILQINSLESDRLELSNIYSMLNRKAGKRVRLKLRRNGQILSKEFWLRKEI
jgi:hypothetical protein